MWRLAVTRLRLFWYGVFRARAIALYGLKAVDGSLHREPTPKLGSEPIRGHSGQQVSSSTRE